GGAASTGGEGPNLPPEVDDPPSILGDIIISTPSQSFRDEIGVELSTDITDAEIRYTIDGTLPTTSSELYSGALTLTETTQLRAQAFVAGEASGWVSTALYIARTFELSST